MQPEIICLDPARHTPELDSFNHLQGLTRVGVSYHLPGMLGMESVMERVHRCRIKGIVVMGSSSSVHDQFSWQTQMHEWVKAKILEGVPVFGFCYGHQMIAKIFGGEIGFSPYKTYHKGFRDITIIDQAGLDLKLVTDAMVVSHQECVTQMPYGFKVFAKSDEFDVEGIYHPSLAVWGIQTHPEATKMFCRSDQYDLKRFDPRNPFVFGHTLVKAFLDFCHSRP